MSPLHSLRRSPVRCQLPLVVRQSASRLPPRTRTFRHESRYEPPGAPGSPAPWLALRTGRARWRRWSEWVSTSLSLPTVVVPTFETIDLLERSPIFSTPPCSRLRYQPNHILDRRRQRSAPYRRRKDRGVMGDLGQHDNTQGTWPPPRAAENSGNLNPIGSAVRRYDQPGRRKGNFNCTLL